MVWCVAEDREDARRRRVHMIDHKKAQQTCASVYAKKGRTYLDNPSQGGSAQYREQSNSLAEVKGEDAGWRRIPQSEDLRRERYLKFQRSAAVSRDGSGTEPMISGSGGLGVMRAYAGSEVAERVHANRVDIGSVRRGSCSVQEKRTLGTSGKLGGKKMRRKEKEWMEMCGPVVMGMKKEGHGMAWLTHRARYGAVRVD